MKEELSRFRPEAITPQRILTTAALAFPDRLGSAIWIDVFQGKADAGLTFRLYRYKKIDVDVLLGQISYGASASYSFYKRGNVALSFGIGAVHPWGAINPKGWSPAAVFRVGF